MSKSMVIAVIALWVLCTLYYSLARIYGYPYVGAAMAGSWIMSGILLLCILLFVRQNRRK